MFRIHPRFPHTNSSTLFGSGLGPRSNKAMTFSSTVNIGIVFSVVIAVIAFTILFICAWSSRRGGRIFGYNNGKYNRWRIPHYKHPRRSRTERGRAGDTTCTPGYECRAQYRPQTEPYANGYQQQQQRYLLLSPTTQSSRMAAGNYNTWYHPAPPGYTM